MQSLDVLVVAPHPDDAEISVGGIIAASIRQNLRVGVVDLTTGEPTPHGTPEIRQRETAKATEILGLTWRKNLVCRIAVFSPHWKLDDGLRKCFG